MCINSLRAVIHTQNQGNYLCIAPCTMAESRVHPALLIVAPECCAGKAASVTLADAVAEGSDSPLHSLCSEPRKKRSRLHHPILSYPVQAGGGQVSPVSSRSSGHTGWKKQDLHNLSWEFHCNTATSQLLLGPHLRATNTVLTSQQLLPRRDYLQSPNKMQEHYSFAVFSEKSNSGLTIFLFQQEQK